MIIITWMVGLVHLRYSRQVIHWLVIRVQVREILPSCISYLTTPSTTSSLKWVSFFLMFWNKWEEFTFVMHLQGTHLRENMKCDTGFLPYRFLLFWKLSKNCRTKQVQYTSDLQALFFHVLLSLQCVHALWKTHREPVMFKKHSLTITFIIFFSSFFTMFVTSNWVIENILVVQEIFKL